jgi:hypothetical protein
MAEVFMSRKSVFGCLAVIMAAAVVQSVQAKAFNMTTGESEVSVWRLASGQKEQVRGASTIGIGDTLFAAGDEDVVIRIERNSKIQVKGGSTLVFAGGGDGAVDAVLDEGQIFLNRGQPRELALVRILAGGYSFTPTGTAAAVKTTRGGAPTVAVLRGAVQMLSAEGETVSVGPGQFGTVNHTGKVVSGDLNERGLQQLSAWTGVQIAQAEEEESDIVSDAGGYAPVSEPLPESPADDSRQLTEAAAPPSALAGDDGAEEPGQPQADHRAGKTSGQPTPLFSKPDFEISAGISTVNGEPWTRLALGVDIPVWRFGVFLDLDLFIDPQGQFSNKGWNFKDDPADAVYRRIRYIRYGRETDPLFIKLGGLSSVSMGYGMIVDRFTNMLRYPEEKLLGLQFNWSDILSSGISVQTLISDFDELFNDGGVIALRAAVQPLKAMNLPIISGLSVGGTYAIDRNTHSPWRRWRETDEERLLKDIRGQTWYEEYRELYEFHTGLDLGRIYERIYEEDEARKKTSSFQLVGLDAGLPLINTSLLGVMLYGHSASRVDGVRGWGVGVPGIAVKVWKLDGAVEYRMVEGRFTPGFFDRYYLDERYSRGLLQEKGEYIDSVSLSGIFGRAGMDVWGLLKLEGSYQYMFIKDGGGHTIRGYEGTVGIGETIMSHIPKINRAEVYLRNSNIGRSDKYDSKGNLVEPGELAGQFDRTPHMYWGYRAGFEIAAGASLIWDYRYGWKIENGRLVPNNHIFLQTALRF